MDMPLFYAPLAPEQLALERRRARELRQSQWWRQQIGPGLCHYCGQKFSKELLTMDHLIPISRGGKSTKGNIVVACKACNTEKKNLTPVEQVMAQMSGKSGADF
jgi:5-methylcytosine-specific restriction endonuclease McrA